MKPVLDPVWPAPHRWIASQHASDVAITQAIADPVFAFDAAGNAYPSLVQGMPVRDGGVTTVKLREGLRSARGVPLSVVYPSRRHLPLRTRVVLEFLIELW